MIPLELKIDKEGLLYTDDNTNLFHRLVSIDKREYKNEYFASSFFRFYSTNDYLVKRPVTVLDRKGREAYKEMLIRLLEKQKDILNTDFPIGYYRERKRLEGLIIRYYKDGISLENINNTNDINLIGKYYSHDEDNIHNLFLLINEVIDRIYEMFENNVYYLDINPGNIIINDNQVKLIDFDPNYIKFDKKDIRLAKIMEFYIDLLNEIIKKYQLTNEVDATLHNFEEAKCFTKKIENRIQRIK